MKVVAWVVVLALVGLFGFGLWKLGVPWWGCALYGGWCLSMAGLFLDGADEPVMSSKPTPHTHWWL